MREASVTLVRKRACSLSVGWCTQQHQARVVGEDNSLQPLEVHCLKQTAEPSLCSALGVCLGIVSAGVCVHEILLAAPGFQHGLEKSSQWDQDQTRVLFLIEGIIMRQAMKTPDVNSTFGVIDGCAVWLLDEVHSGSSGMEQILARVLPKLKSVTNFKRCYYRQPLKLVNCTTIRRVIVATNAAETAVTFSRCWLCVDTCMVNQTMYDASLGAKVQQTVPCSQAASRQRGGCAGRDSPGMCLRLVTQLEWKDMPPKIHLNLIWMTNCTIFAIGIDWGGVRYKRILVKRGCLCRDTKPTELEQNAELTPLTYFAMY